MRNDDRVWEAAKQAHEMNKRYCELHGDMSHVSWDAEEAWKRSSSYDGVLFLAENPESTPEQQHEQWCGHKQEHGWVFGDVKDAELKTHPCLVPYKDLPTFQQAKDTIFQAVVRAAMGL